MSTWVQSYAGQFSLLKLYADSRRLLLLCLGMTQSGTGRDDAESGPDPVDVLHFDVFRSKGTHILISAANNSSTHLALLRQ